MSLLIFALGAVAVCPLKLMGEAERKAFIAEDERRRAAVLEDAPDPTTTTVQGCKCQQACGPSAEDAFNCDWCYTEDNCGHYSYTRLAYYDWCVYAADTSYEAQTWGQKMSFLWGKITENENPGAYESKFNVVTESVQTTFDNQMDWMPVGRHKVIHAVGAVCQVSMDITSTKFTGIFAQGSQIGFFRLGSAIDPVAEGINPGAGFKFLRTGVKSANWVMLDDPNLTDTADWNMFSRNLTNHVSPFEGAAIAVAQKFLQVSRCVTKVGLSDAGLYSQDGTKAADNKFPWMLTMVPTGGVAMPSGATTLDGFMENIIKALPTGTTFYDVMAMDGPYSSWEKIGTMSTIDTCVTSLYGDNQLYFRHQRVEEDWAAREDWYEKVNGDLQSQCGFSVPTLTPPYKCIENEATGTCM